MKEVFVISDLHIGGEGPQAGEQRGFRLCTHTDLLADLCTNSPTAKMPSSNW